MKYRIAEFVICFLLGWFTVICSGLSLFIPEQRLQYVVTCVIWTVVFKAAWKLWNLICRALQENQGGAVSSSNCGNAGGTPAGASGSDMVSGTASAGSLRAAPKALSAETAGSAPLSSVTP